LIIQWKALLLSMTDENRDLVQGTLEMLVLKTLALEPMHGYGIALRIEQISDGVFRVNPGSLLPALSRMERAGHVKAEWRASENNRRAKYYLLTEKGRKALKEERRQWGRQTAAINRILEA
jgi:PadR family transcriptional regulator PadR